MNTSPTSPLAQEAPEVYPQGEPHEPGSKEALQNGEMEAWNQAVQQERSSS